MKRTNIDLTVELDEKNFPENIFWQAADMNPGKPEPTKAISLSLWDHNQKNTLRIDLWTKDMAVEEMKRFIIDSMGGFSQCILNATGDEYMSEEINKLCEKLVEHVKNEQKEQNG